LSIITRCRQNIAARKALLDARAREKI